VAVAGGFTQLKVSEPPPSVGTAATGQPKGARLPAGAGSAGPWARVEAVGWIKPEGMKVQR